uniref:Platelet-derived growth factor (PDGF) family profile domain-containing protein n=1 Tax=Eptatretus burgeri TaxID=7764 RepID=A0A8C4QU73_EPTBU
MGLRLCILLTALHVCVARPMGLQEEGQLSLLLAMMDWSGFRAARHVPAIPRNDSVEVAVAAVCHPRNESVAIPHSLFNDSEGSFVIWPSCVELQRCSGCCTSGIRHCAPANTRQRHFLVTKLEYRGILRKRQVMVTMEEHLQCSCQCAFRLACPKHHAFDHRNCLCVRRHRWRQKCRNEECRARRKKCREEGCRKGARQGRKRGKKDRGKRKNSQEDSSTVLPTTQLQTSQTTA